MGNARKLARFALTASSLALTIAVLLPVLTGRPLVSYASSESMEPTIGVFDAFFVDPWPDGIEVGDIIVYESISRGGPAVHRVVGGDPGGWVTQGDANPSPDQEGAEPVVTPDRILGRVVTRADGAPILLDDAGVTFVEARIQMTRAAQAVGGERQLTALLFLLVAAVSAVPAFFLRGRRAPPTPLPRRLRILLRRVFPRGILGRDVGVVLLLLVLVSGAYTAWHARVGVPIDHVVVTDRSASDGIRAVAPGGETTRDVRVGSLGYMPTIVVIEPGSERVDVDATRVSLGPMSTTDVTARQRAGETPGLQVEEVVLWRYPRLLPEPTIVALHALAPGSPFVVMGVLFVALGAFWYAALGLARLPVARLLGVKEEWL